jgi:hypothetical protein
VVNSSGNNPSTLNSSVTFTATVSDNYSGSTGTPTGTVTFTDSTTLGTATLAVVSGHGVATINASHTACERPG